MSLTFADPALYPRTPGTRLNPAELKIDLLCRGLRLDGSCRIREEGRPVGGRHGDPASGLELILPGEIKELWVNAPVLERFVENSPYHLGRKQGKHCVHDDRNGETYSVKLAPRPKWYDRRTRSGRPMSGVGRMQGTFLSVDFGVQVSGPSSVEAGKGGLDVSLRDVSVEDVVDTALAAQDESGVTYALLRGAAPDDGGVAGIFPCIQALKRDVGILVGVQFPPETNLDLYERSRDLGVDHFSFLFDCFSEGGTGRFAPTCGLPDRRARAMKALEHCVRIMGRGRVSSELMAGMEPIEETMRGIDYFVRVGSIPLIAVFRPLLGTETEDLAPPDFAEMLRVFRYVYQACCSHRLPFSLPPNIRLSMLPHPEDTLYLAPDMLKGESYRRWIYTMQQTMRPYYLRRMRKHAPHRA